MRERLDDEKLLLTEEHIEVFCVLKHGLEHAFALITKETPAFIEDLQQVANGLFRCVLLQFN